MLFPLSKVFWFLAQPSSLLTLALLYGLFALYRLHIERARRWLSVAALGIVLLGFAPLSEFLIAPLEARFHRPNVEGADFAGVIVLGGAEDARAGPGDSLMGLNEAGERVTEAVALARRFPRAKIVYSGGSTDLIYVKPAEAHRAGKLLAALGIDEQRLVLEPISRNTHENAVMTRALITPKPGERWLLVTSAWHMPRAIGCFRAVGFAVEPWPVDYRTVRSLDLNTILLHMPEGLRRIDFAMREYVGLVLYRLSGRTEEFWPGAK
jgi:uncharacterized SAM-binding protein YcdF (DUF218 family)